MSSQMKSRRVFQRSAESIDENVPKLFSKKMLNNSKGTLRMLPNQLSVKFQQEFPKRFLKNSEVSKNGSEREIYGA